jgi:hypothetical protein
VRQAPVNRGAHQAVVPAGVSWPSGVFSGYGPTGDVQFGAWRGTPVTTATDFLPQDTWAQMENPAWAIPAWGPAPTIHPDFSLAMWPWSGGNLADAAAGNYNSHFAALAQNLVAGGLGSATIRLAWEFNGTWYRWSVSNAAQAAQYAEAWRQIVSAMRSVPGSSFSFDWAPTAAQGGINPALAYPGDSYVTDIGLDVYDWNATPGLTPAQRWSQLVGTGYGLAWQTNFAAAHHKPIAFPEWGLASSTFAPASSGGDDPTFVTNMHTWFATHKPAFENYFNSDSPSTGMFDGITTGNGLFPQATAVYRQLF